MSEILSLPKEVKDFTDLLTGRNEEELRLFAIERLRGMPADPGVAGWAQRAAPMLGDYIRHEAVAKIRCEIVEFLGEVRTIDALRVIPRVWREDNYPAVQISAERVMRNIIGALQDEARLTSKFMLLAQRGLNGLRTAAGNFSASIVEAKSFKEIKAALISGTVAYLPEAALANYFETVLEYKAAHARGLGISEKLTSRFVALTESDEFVTAINKAQTLLLPSESVDQSSRESLTRLSRREGFPSPI